MSLGSNLGDRRSYLRGAVARLRGILVHARCSSVYETAPLEGAGPRPFLNIVVGGRTGWEAEQLLNALLEIEADLGRRRAPGAAPAPRTLDIDLLLYGRHVIEKERLSVPHPRMHRRRFVLEPLVEIAPDLQDPRTGVSYRSVLDRLPEQGVRIVGPPLTEGGSDERHTG